MSLPLIPVTSLNTSRYDNPTSVHLCPQVIPKGPASRHRSVLAQWSPGQGLSNTSSEKNGTTSACKWMPFVHPEGQRYFLLPGEFAFDVVTEADVEADDTRERILDCATVASKELCCHDIRVPQRFELFLELGDDRMSCNYYFVDHIGKTLFWLEDICTASLDIQPAASPLHLDTQLQRLYWVHVEFFPMHHESHEQFSQLVGDLYNVISHGQADRLTSTTSTFPYTADTCAHFLKLLSRKRDQRVDGYTLCYSARLAGAIANQRFITFYGQKTAQLDRLQEMFQTNAVQHKWLFTVANRLMWGLPSQYSNLLEDLYVNEQVYADQWTRFVSTCLTDWTTSLSWSLPVFITSVLLANARGGAIATSIPTALSCAVSIASASCLHLRHQPLAGSSASVGARYLYHAKWSTVGFLPSSVVFSLPRASYLWAVGLLAAQFLFVACQSGSRVAALAAATVVSLLMIFVLYVIHPEEASFTSLFQSFTSLYISNMYASDAPEGASMV